MKHILLMVTLVVMSAVYSAKAQDNSGRVFWRGMVDDRVHLVIRGDGLETRTVSGKENPVGVFSFTTPLPDSTVTVSAIKKKGRGKVGVLQHPNADNDFTAIVEIYDDGGGAKEYQLEISWR